MAWTTLVPFAIINSASLIYLCKDQAPRAVKKLDVEPFVERVDAVTNGSRRYVQFLRGEFKTAATSGGFKQTQAIKRRYQPHGKGDQNSPRFISWSLDCSQD